MRNKLQKFTEFTELLLPHETTWLLANQQFDDKTKVAILERVDYNCRRQHGEERLAYDENLDKRKYSNLKLWIAERLRALDVDMHLEWMLDTERKILTDAIEPATEERLLHEIRAGTPTRFYFTRFYELAQSYRHFLLIRMRYTDHELVEAFLTDHRSAWLRSKETGEELHRATLDIVEQYAGNATPSIHWEQRLTDIFYDETLDGWNRYMALVRLTFIYYNYRRFEPLLEKYEYLEQQLNKGLFYSKRILLNYYGNRLMLHVKFREFEKAEYYGYLSVRVKNIDYIHYVNNLCGVLLREKKYREAMSLLKDALPESKTTHSFHNKIGFVSHFVKCQNYLGQYLAAENYAETYLRAYPREIFENRWFLFFTSYLESLLHQRKYAKLLKVCTKHKLLERDKASVNKSFYLPTIRWYYAVAALLTDRDTLDKQQKALASFMPPIQSDPAKRQQLVELIELIKTHHSPLSSYLAQWLGGREGGRERGRDSSFFILQG
jgi:hypothetical protein